MARPKKTLGRLADLEIAQGVSRGWTLQQIQDALAAHGTKISMGALHERVHALQTKPRPVEVGEIPVDEAAVPADARIEQYDQWIAIARRNATAMEAQGNVPALARLVSLASALLQARTKAMPLPKADPNENPDMRELGDKAYALLASLVEEACRA